MVPYGRSSQWARYVSAVASWSGPLCPRACAAAAAMDFGTVNNLLGLISDVGRPDMKELVAACA